MASPQVLDIRVEDFFRDSRSPLFPVYRVCSSQLSSSLRSGVAGGAPGSLPTSLSALLTDGAALAQAPTATLGARACPVGAGAVHDVCASVRSPACDAYVARMAAAWEESSAAPAAAAAAAAPPLAVAVAALEDLSLNRTAPDSRCVAALLQAFSAAGRGVRAIDILASCAQGVMSALTSPAPPEGAAAQGGRPATPSEAWGCAVDVVLSAEAVCAALGALGCEGRPDLCLWLWRAYGRACEERARRAGARRELAAPAHQPASPYAAPWVQGREPVTLELPPREACAVHATVVGALCCALTSACTLVAAPSPLRAPLWDTSLPSSAAAQAASGLLAAAAAAEGGGGGGGGGGGSGGGSGSGRPCAEFSAASAALTAMAEAINGVHAGWGGASFASGGRDTHTPQPAPLPAAALAALAVWHRYSGSKAASRHLQSTLFQGVSRFELGGGGSSGGSGVAALGGGSTRALALPGAGSAEEPNDLQSFLAMLWSSTQCGAGSLTRELLAHASRPGALPLAPLLAPPSADSSSSSSSSGGSAAARQLSCTALAASLWYAGHASRGDVECETGAGQALRSTLGSIHNPLRSIFDAACAPASAAAGSDQLAHQNLLPLVQRLALAAEEGAGGSSAAAAAAAAAGTPVYAPAAPLAAAALTPSAVKPYDSPALTPISHLAANLRCAFLVSSGNLARAITEFMCCHAAPPAASPGEAAAPGSLSGAAAQWAAVRPSAGAASGTAAAPSPPLGAPYSPAVFAPFPETLTLLLHGIVSDCGAFGRSASRLALPAWLLSQPSPAPTSLLGAVGAGAGAGGAGAPTVVDSAGAVLSLVTRVLYAADARGVSPRLADYAAVAELHGVLGTCRLALADIRGGGGSGGSGAAAAAAEPGEGGAASAVGTWGRAGATLLYASVLSGMARSGGSVLRREDVEWLGARAAEDGVGFPRLLGAGGSVGADTLAYRSGLFTGLSAEEGEAIPSYFSAAVEAVDAGLRGEEGAGAGGGGGGGGGGGAEDAHFSAATVARPSAWTAHAIFGTTREGGASYAASLAADRSYTSAALPSLASNSSQSTAEAVAAAAAAPPAGVQPSALAHLVTLSLPSLRAASASAALGLMLTRCLSYELCGASAVSAAQRLAAGRGALTPSALATLLSFTKSRGSSASSASAASLASLAGSGSPSAGAGKAALLASEARAVPPPILFHQQQQQELQQLQQFQQSASSQFVTLSFSEYDRERAAEVEGAAQSAASASASTPSKRLLPFGAWRSSAPVSSLMPGASAAHSGASAASAQLGTASRPLSLQASLEAARVPPPVSAALLSGGWAYGTSAQITSAASFGGGSSALAPMALPLTVASLLASSSAWAYDTVGHLPSADEARAGSEAAQLALARASGAPSAFALELPTLFSALATASPCQAEYAEDAQGQPLVHAATLSEHTHTLEAQLRSVHRETADLEAQLLGLSGALMLCESDLCASLSASRDSQRMVGAAMVGACRVTGEAIPGMLITGEEGGAAVAAGAAAAAAGETTLPARLVLMSQRSALLKLLQAQEAEALDLERVLLGTREADGGEGGPPQPLRLHAAAAGQAPEAWPGGGSSRSTPYPPQHPSQFNLSTVSPLVLPASRMLQRYFSASLGMEENCRELSAAAARDEAAALALEDSLSLSQAALRSWALSNMTQGAVADASQGGRVFSQPAPHPKAAALLAALSTAPVNAAVRDLRKGRVRARETLRSAAASADALAAVLDSYVEAGEARVAAKRECARAAVAGEVELEALHSAGTALETSARMAMWALEKRRKEVAERHQAESRALADSIARVRSSMMAEMGSGGSGAGRGTVMHLSTALLLGASTPSSVASAAGILAAREAMLGGAIALGESTAAAAGALALEEERANSEHGAALAREEVNKLLSNRAHKRAGEHVMAWAQPASLLEEHCLEQEEALTSARDLGALVAGESAVLAALQRELEAARQEWTYTATLLDARNFARNATREALAADKAASAATAGSTGARALSFYATEAAQGAGPMGQSQGQYNSQIEELCGLFGECGGTALELWTLVSRAIEPLQRQGTAALAPSGPRHSAPAEAGVSLSILDTVVDLLEEELGAYRASILATPLGSVTTSLPSAELSASLSSLRRSPYSSGSPASPVTPSVVRYLAAAM